SGELTFKLRVETKAELSTAANGDHETSSDGRGRSDLHGLHMASPSPTSPPSSGQVFRQHSGLRRLLDLFRHCHSTGGTKDSEWPPSPPQDRGATAAPAGPSTAQVQAPGAPYSGTGSRSLGLAETGKVGSGKYGIRTYTVKVPPLEMSRPPLGSLEHALAMGEDF
ncbi:hypothetical protein Vretifemale_5451, partial [Volvox reticuliferus]